MEPGDDPYVGRTIDGRYAVHRLVGRGGMGVVYEATHVGLDKRIAIKFLIDSADDADALARFRREARVASKIDHENVVNILDVGRDGTTDYLAMELVDGQDLQRMLNTGGAFTPARAIALIRQVLHGLAAIHAAGIVHRDLKPSNVIVVGEVAKIMDFGISKSVAAGDSITQTGAVIGTPMYMSPEQLLGDELDHRSDLFAVGLILFALLAGEPPFSDNTVSRLAAKYATQAAPSLATRRRDLPVELVEVVDRAVARRREDRFPTAEAFERALGSVDLGGPIAAADRWNLRTADARAPEPPTKVERPVSKPPRGTWLAAGVLLVGAAIALAVIATRTPSTTVPDAAVAITPDAAVPVPVDALDQLGLARRADADGKLELAIALYADLPPTPAIAFRLGELHERTGNADKAVAAFTRYLELAPAAADRDHVKARIARLAPKPVVVVTRRPVPEKPALPAKKCWCFPGNGSDATHFRLCRGLAKEPKLCSCRGPIPGGSGRGTLCSKPGEKCSGSQGKCYDALECDDPGWGKNTIVAKTGDPCTGYRHTDELVQGTYDCSVCDPDLGYRFEGQNGDACVGYSFTDGKPVDGHLNNCQ